MPEGRAHHVLDSAGFAVGEFDPDLVTTRTGFLFWSRRFRWPWLAGSWLARLPGLWIERFPVPLWISEVQVRPHEVVDGEIILAVVEPRAAPDDLLELDDPVDRCMSTMFLMLCASTPVDSFWEVVRMVGTVFSLS